MRANTTIENQAHVGRVIYLHILISITEYMAE